MKQKKIKNVSEFLGQIDVIIRELTYGNDKLCVFRGEQERYAVSGMPNIFRDESNKKLSEIKYFEQNILDELSSHSMQNKNNNLQKAINAQHGGFPSRLLDVSFNSLIALFFAVTPHYSKNIKSSDGKDAVVIIYNVDELYSPMSKNLSDEFNELIKGKYNEVRLLNYKHLIIDHSYLNERIVAQQGGFILFKGNEFVQYPKHKQKQIIIDGAFKEQIRHQLETNFGYNMGTVYPEIFNKVDYLLKKSELLNNDTYEINNSLNKSVESIVDSIDGYIQSIKLGKYNLINKKINQNTYNDLLIEFEEYLETAYMTIEDFKKSSLSVDGIYDEVKDKFEKHINSTYEELEMLGFLEESNLAPRKYYLD